MSTLSLRVVTLLGSLHLISMYDYSPSDSNDYFIEPPDDEIINKLKPKFLNTRGNNLPDLTTITSGIHAVNKKERNTKIINKKVDNGEKDKLTVIIANNRFVAERRSVTDTQILLNPNQPGVNFRSEPRLRNNPSQYDIKYIPNIKGPRVLINPNIDDLPFEKVSSPLQNKLNQFSVTYVSNKHSHKPNLTRGQFRPLLTLQYNTSQSDIVFIEKQSSLNSQKIFNPVQPGVHFRSEQGIRNIPSQYDLEYMPNIKGPRVLINKNQPSVHYKSVSTPLQFNSNLFNVQYVTNQHTQFAPKFINLHQSRPRSILTRNTSPYQHKLQSPKLSNSKQVKAISQQPNLISAQILSKPLLEGQDNSTHVQRDQNQLQARLELFNSNQQTLQNRSNSMKPKIPSTTKTSEKGKRTTNAPTKTVTTTVFSTIIPTKVTTDTTQTKKTSTSTHIVASTLKKAKDLQGIRTTKPTVLPTEPVASTVATLNIPTKVTTNTLLSTKSTKNTQITDSQFAIEYKAFLEGITTIKPTASPTQAETATVTTTNVPTKATTNILRSIKRSTARTQITSSLFAAKHKAFQRIRTTEPTAALTQAQTDTGTTTNIPAQVRTNTLQSIMRSPTRTKMTTSLYATQHKAFQRVMTPKVTIAPIQTVTVTVDTTRIPTKVTTNTMQSAMKSTKRTQSTSSQFAKQMALRERKRKRISKEFRDQIYKEVTASNGLFSVVLEKGFNYLALKRNEVLTQLTNEIKPALKIWFSKIEAGGAMPSRMLNIIKELSNSCANRLRQEQKRIFHEASLAMQTRQKTVSKDLNFILDLMDKIYKEQGEEINVIGDLKDIRDYPNITRRAIDLVLDSINNIIIRPIYQSTDYERRTLIEYLNMYVLHYYYPQNKEPSTRRYRKFLTVFRKRNEISKSLKKATPSHSNNYNDSNDNINIKKQSMEQKLSSQIWEHYVTYYEDYTTTSHRTYIYSNTSPKLDPYKRKNKKGIVRNINESKRPNMNRGKEFRDKNYKRVHSQVHVHNFETNSEVSSTETNKQLVYHDDRKTTIPTKSQTFKSHEAKYFDANVSLNKTSDSLGEQIKEEALESSVQYVKSLKKFTDTSLEYDQDQATTKQRKPNASKIEKNQPFHTNANRTPDSLVEQTKKNIKHKLYVNSATVFIEVSETPSKLHTYKIINNQNYPLKIFREQKNQESQESDKLQVNVFHSSNTKKTPLSYHKEKDTITHTNTLYPVSYNNVYTPRTYQYKTLHSNENTNTSPSIFRKRKKQKINLRNKAHVQKQKHRSQEWSNEEEKRFTYDQHEKIGLLKNNLHSVVKSKQRTHKTNKNVEFDLNVNTYKPSNIFREEKHEESLQSDSSMVKTIEFGSELKTKQTHILLAHDKRILTFTSDSVVLEPLINKKKENKSLYINRNTNITSGSFREQNNKKVIERNEPQIDSTEMSLEKNVSEVHAPLPFNYKNALVRNETNVRSSKKRSKILYRQKKPLLSSQKGEDTTTLENILVVPSRPNSYKSNENRDSSLKTNKFQNIFREQNNQQTQVSDKLQTEKPDISLEAFSIIQNVTFTSEQDEKITAFKNTLHSETPLNLNAFKTSETIEPDLNKNTDEAPNIQNTLKNKPILLRGKQEVELKDLNSDLRSEEMSQSVLQQNNNINIKAGLRITNKRDKLVQVIRRNMYRNKNKRVKNVAHVDSSQLMFEVTANSVNTMSCLQDNKATKRSYTFDSETASELDPYAMNENKSFSIKMNTKEHKRPNLAKALEHDFPDSGRLFISSTVPLIARRHNKPQIASQETSSETFSGQFELPLKNHKVEKTISFRNTLQSKSPSKISSYRKSSDKGFRAHYINVEVFHATTKPNTGPEIQKPLVKNARPINDMFEAIDIFAGNDAGDLKVYKNKENLNKGNVRLGSKETKYNNTNNILSKGFGQINQISTNGAKNIHKRTYSNIIINRQRKPKNYHNHHKYSKEYTNQVINQLNANVDYNKSYMNTQTHASTENILKQVNKHNKKHRKNLQWSSLKNSSYKKTQHFEHSKRNINQQEFISHGDNRDKLLKDLLMMRYDRCNWKYKNRHVINKSSAENKTRLNNKSRHGVSNKNKHRLPVNPLSKLDHHNIHTKRRKIARKESSSYSYEEMLKYNIDAAHSGDQNKKPARRNYQASAKISLSSSETSDKEHILTEKLYKRYSNT